MDEKQLRELLEKSLAELLAKSMGGVEKNLNTIIEEKFKQTVKELNLDKLDLKHGMFPVAGADDQRVAKAARFSKFMKYVFAKDAQGFAKEFYGEQKDFSGSVDSEGGFLVPTEFVAEIQRLATAFGLIRKYATVVPMASDKMALPSSSGAVQLQWQGTQNKVVATKTSVPFGQVILNADTLSGISVLPNQLLADANVNIMDFLMTLFAEAYAKEEDYQGLRGTGTPFRGVLNEDGVNVVTLPSGTAFTDLTLDDLLDMQTALPTMGRVGGAYLMHTQIWGHVQKIKQNNQNVVTFQNPVMQMGDLMNYTPLTPVGQIWNCPVILSDTMPDLSESAAATPFVALGSIKRGIMLGDKNKMTTDISNQAVVGGESTFERNQSAVRVTEQIAIKLNLPQVFVRLRTHA